MKRTSIVCLATCLLTGPLIGLRGPTAHAALGAAEASIDADRQTIAGSRHVPVMKNAYAVHEIANPHLRLREYVAHGVVFGIAWDGASTPDLAPLLGSYLAEFADANRAAARAKVRGRRSRSRLQGPHLVVERAGHMGALHGHAFVMDLLPAGVTADDIL